MRSATRLVVMDLDGTLVDSKEDLARAVNHALHGVGLPERATAEIATFVGHGESNLVRCALGPANEHLLRPALELWWAHYEEHLLDRTVLYPGLRELLDAARVPLAVHTNKPGVLARRILDGLGVLERFVEVVGGDEGPRKPDPAGTRALLERRGVAAHDALLVGDSLVDLRTARAVPMRFVAVTWGFVPEDRLVEGGAEVRVTRTGDLAPWLAAS
jgi:phosphoglycolate phosphatase